MVFSLALISVFHSSCFLCVCFLNTSLSSNLFRLALICIHTRTCMYVCMSVHMYLEICYDFGWGSLADFSGTVTGVGRVFGMAMGTVTDGGRVFKRRPKKERIAANEQE